VYSFGQSEIILGKFLKKYNIPRESVVIMTKTYHPDNRDNKADMKAPSGWTNLSGLGRKASSFTETKIQCWDKLTSLNSESLPLSRTRSRGSSSTTWMLFNAIDLTKTRQSRRR
jgi:aryl-alcohol dehydrogenase-like predicted oxidoreductase